MGVEGGRGSELKKKKMKKDHLIYYGTGRESGGVCGRGSEIGNNDNHLIFHCSGSALYSP